MTSENDPDSAEPRTAVIYYIAAEHAERKCDLEAVCRHFGTIPSTDTENEAKSK